MPSWVPDWSVNPAAIPLPVRRGVSYLDVPWWLEPPDGSQEHAAEIRPLESGISSGGYVAPPYTYLGYHFHGPPKSKHDAYMEKCIRRKRLRLSISGLDIADCKVVPKDPDLWHAAKEECGTTSFDRVIAYRITQRKDEKDIFDSHPATNKEILESLIRAGETETAREQKFRVLRALQDFEAPFSAGMGGTKSIDIDLEKATCTLSDIIWDTNDIVHDAAFPSDINGVWQNATHFMVEVGCCKILASKHAAFRRRYPSSKLWAEAFWSTLFVGQTRACDVFDPKLKENELMTYTNWLPEVDLSWTAQPPPLTPITTGLLCLAESHQKFHESLQVHIREGLHGASSGGWKHNIDNIELAGSTEPDTGPPSLIPISWSQDETDYYREQFDRLASKWHRQPYDLYHRPFRLLNVVPDPFWRCREESDDLTKRKTRRYIRTAAHRPAAGVGAIPDGLATYEAAVEMYEERMRGEVSMDPQGTLEEGLENYALGRRFFITKRGYLGLGSAEVKADDRIAIIFGLEMPLILRKHPRETGLPGYQVVGETYVQDIMRGEVIDRWRDGYVEATKMVLR